MPHHLIVQLIKHLTPADDQFSPAITHLNPATTIFQPGHDTGFPQSDLPRGGKNKHLCFSQGMQDMKTQRQLKWIMSGSRAIGYFSEPKYQL